VKEYLAALPGDQMLMKKASGPFAGGYKPELDESPEPTDPKRIVKAERFAFQLVPRFFFLLCRVNAALERLEVPSYSSEDSSSSSSSSGKLNLSILVLNAAMERVSDLMVTAFPVFLPLLLPATV
jgi:hypothetical protein